MTNRERIINTVLCKKTDRLPFMHMFGPWPETIERWESEGLEDGQKWKQGFGFDAGLIEVAVNYGYSPAYEYQILEDRGDTLIARDTFGIIAESLKVGSSIPRYIEYPVKDHDDWEKMKKERLDPDDVRRFPDNWNELIRFYNEGDVAVQLGVFPYGLFGTLRDMMGVEELLVSFYQQPDLIHEMMDYLTDIISQNKA